MKIAYVLTIKETGHIVRNQYGNILVFSETPKMYSLRYNILAIKEEEINEIIYNENLNKDGL